MEKNAVLIGNSLICDFLRANKIRNGLYYFKLTFAEGIRSTSVKRAIFSDKTFTVKDMKFHSNKDWLAPVITICREKCMSTKDLSGDLGFKYDSIIESLRNNNHINYTYLKVLDFVEYYMKKFNK